jgi:hypothetical protein
MKKFESISLDYRLCQKEVEQFRIWREPGGLELPLGKVTIFRRVL